MIHLIWLLAFALTEECRRGDTTIGIYTEDDFRMIKSCPCCDYAIATNISFSEPIVPVPVFSGALYGQNYTLSNVRFDISGSLDQYVDCGIFGFLDGGMVADIIIDVSHQFVDNKIINFGVVAGRAYNPRLYMIKVTGKIDGTVVTPGNSDTHPHLDKGCSFGGIVGLFESEDGPSTTELQGCLTMSISNTNKVNYPLNFGVIFGRAESVSPFQHLIVHKPSMMDINITSSTTAYVGGSIGYSAADVINAIVDTVQVTGTINGASTDTPTLYIGGAFGAVGSAQKIQSLNKNISCVSSYGTCVSGGIAGMVSTNKAVRNLTFNKSTEVICDASSCVTGGVIGSAIADKLENMLFYGSVKCRISKHASCGGVFGNVYSSFTRAYSYAARVEGLSRSDSANEVMYIGGLAGVVGGNLSNGEILNVSYSVANVSSINAVGSGSIFAGGFSARIMMPSVRLIRVFSSAAYSNSITANETSTQFSKGNRASAAGFVALSTLTRYDFSYAYNTGPVIAVSKQSSVTAGGFIGDGLETQSNHLMIYNENISATTSAPIGASIHVGGFAGGLEGVALVRYIGVFSNSVEGVSTSQADMHIGGFVGIMQGAHSYGGFCDTRALIAQSQGSSGRYSLGGFVGTLSGITSYLNGAWSRANIKVNAPPSPALNANVDLRVGGFVGAMDSLSAMNSTQAFGSIEIYASQTPKVGAMVGSVDNGNVSACMSNVTYKGDPIPASFDMIGYASGNVNLESGSMNFQVVKSVPTPSATANTTYLTWAQAKDNQSYKNPLTGEYYHGFNFSVTDKYYYLAKYDGEYPGLHVLPNPCSIENPRWKQGNYCIFVEFNVYVTLDNAYMSGQPFIAEKVAADICPELSICRGKYKSPENVSCAQGFSGVDCANCTSNEACQNGGKCIKPSGSLYGACKCAPGYDGVDCGYALCGGYNNKQCGGIGQCTSTSDGFYVCKCPSPEYYIRNQACIKGCPGLNSGLCIGPPSVGDHNMICPPGLSYGNFCGSRRNGSSIAYPVVIAILVIITVIAVVLLILVATKKLTFGSGQASTNRSQINTALLDHNATNTSSFRSDMKISRVHSFDERPSLL